MAKRTNHPAQLDWLTLAAEPLLPFNASKSPEPSAETGPDFANIIASETAKRMYEIALTGGHRLCFMGCPQALEDIRPLHDAAAALAAKLGLDEPDAAIGGSRKARMGSDLFVEVMPTPEADRKDPYPCEDSATIGERIVRGRLARRRVTEAWGKSLSDGSEFVHPLAKRLMAQAIEAMELDTIQQGRVVQVTLTIAALAGADTLQRVHVAEALSYCRSYRHEGPPRDPETEEPEEPVAEEPSAPEEEPQPVLVDWPEGAVRPTHPVHLKDERPFWQTNAYQWHGEILASPGRPAPIEMTIRGIRTVIAFGMGFGTHAIDPPGSPYWSETGFRSFTCSPTTDPDEIRSIIEAHIDAPTKNHMGLGGKLVTWWPVQIRQLQDYRRWSVEMPERDHGERIAALEAAVRADGFDPDVVAPWPAKARQKAFAL